MTLSWCWLAFGLALGLGSLAAVRRPNAQAALTALGAAVSDFVAMRSQGLRDYY